MQGVASIAIAFLLGLLFEGAAGAQPASDPRGAVPASAANASLLRDPPTKAGPVLVQADSHLRDLNEIDDEAETFEFEWVLTLRWRDERQAFDPAELGVDEQIYQGDYQFNEVFTGWFPQVILVNESGLDDKHGVVLRVKPGGALTLIQKIDAVAEADLDLRRYPLDRQQLEVVFEVLGFDETEVLLQTDSKRRSAPHDVIRIPQWTLESVSTSIRSRLASYAGSGGISSALVVSMVVKRGSSFMLRLVFFPLVLIVMLSWSVFWMERSSLADRIKVSFIGILTAVVINLVVAKLDKQGKFEARDRVDKRCRWIFPLANFGWIAVITGAALIFY